eukprot:366245-Chlamydomonas_euryale.AAC.20
MDACMHGCARTQPFNHAACVSPYTTTIDSFDTLRNGYAPAGSLPVPNHQPCVWSAHSRYGRGCDSKAAHSGLRLCRLSTNIHCSTP